MTQSSKILNLNEMESTNATTNKRDYEKKTNIILLGESGSGKSTFINAFYNYIHMETLSDAEKTKGPCKALIGSKISFTNREDYTSYTVKIGRDDNECFDVVGQSQTQEAKAHEIEIKRGRELLRIIDTPGKLKLTSNIAPIIQSEIIVENVITTGSHGSSKAKSHF